MTAITYSLRFARLFAATPCLVLLMAVGCGGGSGASVNDDALTGKLGPELQQQLGNGEAALQLEEYTVALAYADSAITASPELADGHYLRGKVYSALNQFGQATEAYEKSIALNPSFRGAWYRLGNDAIAQGQSEQALRYFEKEQEVIAGTPAERRRLYEHIDKDALPAVFIQMGKTYKLLNRTEEARGAYEEALAADSSRAEAHHLLSGIYGEEGELEKALQHAGSAVELEPENAEYRFAAGSLLNRSGKPREAVDLLRSVVQQDPWHEAANYNLGQVLLRLGENEEGGFYLARVDSVKKLHQTLSESRAAAHKQPEVPARWTQLGKVLIQIGKYDEARRALGAAAHLEPQNLAIQNDLANLSLAVGDTTDALRRFTGILRQDSTHADVWLNLGVVHAMSGRYGEARKAWEKTLEYQPTHPDAKVYLARLPAGR